MNLVYVNRRFPKVSETFVLEEMRELRRQGETVTSLSISPPYQDEPLHPGAEELALGTAYVPEGLRRFFVLTAAALRTLSTSPRRAAPALWWSLLWAARDRTIEHLKRFGEAAYLRRRVPRSAEHIHAQFAHSPASVALILARLTGLPFSFTGHAKDIFELVSPRLLQDKMAEARFVVAVCEYARRHLECVARREDRSKIVVVRNGIDRARFTRRRAEPTGVPLVLSVSRLVEKKGLDTLVEACADLAERGLEFRCEIVGDGPGRARLEEKAETLRVTDRFSIAGHRDHDAVREMYERAAVFALPCKRTRSGNQDALPVAIVEALSVGVPVVTTAIAGIPEIVRDGKSGLLVEPRDHRGLAEAIRRALSDGELRTRLADGGARAAEPFALADCVQRLRGLFHDGIPRA
ncbi:MAG TPA: glycosyltransferase [Candidatus Limnocylindria bacterium]|jgi:glycosyltransferase involved in cell wall biosynthesis|nr:glycosyltransferase [Candidatus Limnocylindria bacterium]